MTDYSLQGQLKAIEQCHLDQNVETRQGIEGESSFQTEGMKWAQSYHQWNTIRLLNNEAFRGLPTKAESLKWLTHRFNDKPQRVRTELMEPQSADEL